MNEQIKQIQEGPDQVTDQHTARERMPRKIKTVLIAIGIIVLLYIVYNILPFIMSLFTSDIAPPDDSDLQLETVNIPEDQNMYYDLLAFGGPIDSDIKARITLDEENYEKFSSHIYGNEWDESFVNETLIKNKEAFDVFDAASKKQYYQDPGKSSPDGFRADSVLPPLNNLRVLARLDAIRALSFFKQGKEKEGFDEAIKIIDFGQKIQDSQLALIHYLVSLGIKEIGNDVIRKMAVESNSSAEDLVAYINILQKYKDSKKGLETAMKGEYAMHSDFIDAMALGVDGDDYGVREFLESVGPIEKLSMRYYFRPNKTKQLFIDWAKRHILRMGKPCNVANQELEIVNEKFEEEMTSMFKAYFTENYAGMTIVGIVEASLGGLYTKRCNSELLSSINQLLFALKAFEHEENRLPASLSELAPRYIDDIPTDPFDGKEVRYSSDKGILYSVGEDGIDSGGSEGDDWKKMEDPTFIIGL